MSKSADPASISAGSTALASSTETKSMSSGFTAPNGNPSSSHERSPYTVIIRKPRPVANYSILDNLTIRDHRLSFRARGVLCYLLSMPDNWRSSADRIAQVGVEGRDAVRKALDELERWGYIRRVKHQDEKGRWTTELHVYDRPNRSRVEILGDILGKGGQPMTENPTSDNQASKERLITNDLVKESETLLETQEQLCGYCGGQGVILDGFMGQPMVCPDCRGDGIARP